MVEKRSREGGKNCKNGTGEQKYGRQTPVNSECICEVLT